MNNVLIIMICLNHFVTLQNTINLEKIYFQLLIAVGEDLLSGLLPPVSDTDAITGQDTNVIVFPLL